MPTIRNINRERVINVIAERFETAAAGLNDCADNYQRMEIIQAQVSICRLIASDLSLAGNVSRRVETLRTERETSEARAREERQRVREAERHARSATAEREAIARDATGQCANREEIPLDFSPWDINSDGSLNVTST